MVKKVKKEKKETKPDGAKPMNEKKLLDVFQRVSELYYEIIEEFANKGDEEHWENMIAVIAGASRAFHALTITAIEETQHAAQAVNIYQTINAAAGNITTYHFGRMIAKLRGLGPKPILQQGKQIIVPQKRIVTP